MTPLSRFSQTVFGRVLRIGRDEAWRPVVGYEGFYEVSNLGRVRFAATSAIKPAHDDGRGYWQVNLSRFKEQRTHKVHRLVAWAFLGDLWNPLHCHVAHLDGNPKNNAVSNLKWVSRAENETHKVWHGREPKGERNGRSKITKEQAQSIKERYRAGESCPTLAREFGLARSHTHRIATGEAWK